MLCLGLKAYYRMVTAAIDKVIWKNLPLGSMWIAFQAKEGAQTISREALPRILVKRLDDPGYIVKLMKSTIYQYI